jgi:simple sugar transport system ATP-binding protein
MTQTLSTKTVGPSLEVAGLTMRFGAFVALHEAAMRVQAGSFHALLGENGAGKSTLVKCVIGYQRATAGDVLLNDKTVSFQSTRDAHAAGIGMVYQHFTLVQNMTVAENLVLVRDHVPAIVDWKAELAKLEKFMDEMPFRVPLRAPVHTLSAGEKQRLEILKQLYLGRRLLFLDEPTSTLTPDEASQVLGLLHGMTRKKQLTVLMITHRFREVTAFCDEVTVLRRGKTVGGGKVAELGIDAMAKLMVGEESLRPPVPRTAAAKKAPRLVIKDLSAHDDAGMNALANVCLDVHPGEIVGVAGVSGNGQSELVEVLSGQRRRSAGSVAVSGQPYAAGRAQMQALKVHVLPELPLSNACVPMMSVGENIALREFDKAPIMRGGAFVSTGAIRQKAEKLIARFGIKTPSSATPIRNLSGGNVQRAVLARELAEPAELLVVANPCFGLDFSASADVRAEIVEARNRGAAVLLISEDLDELMELADRLCVMFDGSVVLETTPSQTDVASVGRYMAGQA